MDPFHCMPQDEFEVSHPLGTIFCFTFLREWALNPWGMCWGDFHKKGINVGVLACWQKWQVIRQRRDNSYLSLRGVEEGVILTCHSFVPPLHKTHSFCKQNSPYLSFTCKVSAPLSTMTEIWHLKSSMAEDENATPSCTQVNSLASCLLPKAGMPLW